MDRLTEYKLEDVAKLYEHLGLWYVKLHNGKVYEVEDLGVLAKIEEVLHV